MSLKEHPDSVFPTGSIEVSRIMTVDDTNLSGNVHGGTILKMIDEAGTIIATRHCNKVHNDGTAVVWAVIARVEKTHFVKPMFVGELATVHAELTYSSEHSIEVKVLVFAEDLTKSVHKLTNKAFLWYVPVAVGTGSDSFKVAEVPALEYQHEMDREEGRKRYEEQKEARKKKEEFLEKIPCGISYPITSRINTTPHTVGHSVSSLVYFVQTSDCNMFKICNGGVAMKAMDNVAGMVAFRHANSNVVTVSIDAIDFHNPVKLGEIMNITGRMIFTSAKSMEIKVVVDVENILEKRRFRALSAFFYFVALGRDGKPCNVPLLKTENEEERCLFEEGKQRYEERKKERK